MNPKFSLIIPIYNVEPYLRKCLDSIWVQDYQNWEALLIDDGSPDNSPSICDEYSQKDSRFRVFHKSNGGVSSARNVGLDNAQGDWVWFVDPDDWIHPQALSILEDSIRKYVCDTVFFGIEYYDENSHLIGQEDRELIVDKFKDDTIQLTDYPPQNYLLNRNVLETRKIRFTEGIATGEDLEYQYKYLMTCKTPISIPNRLYMCLRRQGSAMRNPKTKERSANSTPMVLINLVEFIEKYDIESSKWLEERLKRRFKAMLNSNVSVVPNPNFQYTIRDIRRRLLHRNFGFLHNKDIVLASYCYNLYCVIFQFVHKHEI